MATPFTVEHFRRWAHALILDNDEPWELEESGTREGYINIPLRELEKRLGELPKDKAILTA